MADRQNTDERALGLTADPVSRTYWVYTDKSILEVLVKNEDRDVWRAKLERGDHTGALSFVKVSFPSYSRGRELMTVCSTTRYRPLETRRRAFRTRSIHPGRSMLCQIKQIIRIRLSKVYRCR
jgi:hypothetical protein